MINYISPILGKIKEEIYNQFIKSRSQNYNIFIESMKHIKYSYLRSGIIVAETKFKDIEVSGSEIYNYLINFGFNESNAVNITRIFSVNNRLINRLIDKGIDKKTVIYEMDLKERLKSLGLKSATVTTSYAIEDKFKLNKLIKEEIYYIPPTSTYYHSEAAYTYPTSQGYIATARVKVYSDHEITEQELSSKWNEANENLNTIINAGFGKEFDLDISSLAFDSNGGQLNVPTTEIPAGFTVNEYKGKLSIKARGQVYDFDLL